MLNAPSMIVIEVILILNHPLFYFIDLVEFQSGIQILSLELEKFSLEGDLNISGVLYFFQ